MCGLTGFIDYRRDKDDATLAALVTAMNDKIAHRGPDGSGIWTDRENGIALGHRRLTIIDLSETGHQPMTSGSGRYVISYNGEIYNFRDLRTELEQKKYTFRGTSDTEVLLSAIEEWGLSKTLQKANGMFAFALWDKKDRVMHLARDRLGKKPMYYGWMGDVFLFGSELKALRAHPDFQAVISTEALSAFLRHNYVPVPLSIFENIYKLPQASFITIPADARERPEPQKYWDIKNSAEAGLLTPSTETPEQMLESLDSLITEAVRIRMISDVPLGAFLSGGIDSSLITALMQKISPSPVRTFCVGFEESLYNEAKSAKEIAVHLGTDHTEFYVTAAEAQAVIPDLPVMFDEPFADSSQIPTHIVSKLARQHVTVILTGDGGDESFAGYARYKKAEQFANMVLRWPHGARANMAKIIAPMVQSKQRLRRAGEMAQSRDQDHFYDQLMSYCDAPSQVMQDGNYPPPSAHLPQLNSNSFVQRMMFRDTVSYLSDDILAKLDRASMAVALEARAPLLDYNVIEYAWSLPLEQKREKAILKKILSHYVPEHLYDRPKQGFGIPHAEWLRGPLRDWADDLLSIESLERSGFFKPAPIQAKWQAHRDGREDWGYHLWGFLMFQAWYQRNMLNL